MRGELRGVADAGAAGDAAASATTRCCCRTGDGAHHRRAAAEEKDAISHRGQAFRALAPLLAQGLAGR